MFDTKVNWNRFKPALRKFVEPLVTENECWELISPDLPVRMNGSCSARALSELCFVCYNRFRIHIFQAHGSWFMFYGL